ncbi:helix-turn-helix domain-containing protein [Actinokineospora iranica]|uniref:Helix-turn-helix domain-containing protein n=1 Tax=Actinokineospora iranica TaxID=1271860 RepID=A0A1G6YD44_9PSEU|nr:helix-turn-helix transcriptional regulator [Actinokineospora iranica]SDD88299.1 Helix-turn-helix domain-containing protein [Actinokineospora iranica]
MRIEPTLPVRVLGTALRELRQRTGITQEEAAARLLFNNRKISRLETFQVPSHHELLAMLDLYGVPVNDWEPYVIMREEAKARGWWREFGLDDRGYVPLEAQAVSVRSFQLAAIPTLLQTPDHVRATTQSTKAVLLHRRRKQRLTENPPLRLHAIIHASSLDHTAPHMAEQRRHIAELAELDNVTVQILPPSPQPTVRLVCSFSLLDFPTHAEIACVDHPAGTLQLRKKTETRAYTNAFDNLTTTALSPEESLTLLRRTTE